MRCMNDETELGALAWKTRSRSPTSIPNSSVDVHTMATFVPCWNEASARRRSSGDTELWWTNTEVPWARIRSATVSVSARLWQKKRLFLPAAMLCGVGGELGAPTRGSTMPISRRDGSFGGSTTTPSRSEDAAGAS